MRVRLVDLSALALLAACSADFSLSAPQVALVKGRATSGGEPLSGAALRLVRTELKATSGIDGSFRIHPVPLGSYVLEASIDRDGDGAPDLARDVPVELVAGGEDLDLGDVDLLPPGLVTGTVRAAGAPVSGAMVFVPGTQRVAFTDRAGAYTLSGVPAGSRDVAGGANGFSPAVQHVEVASGTATSGVDFALEASDGTPVASFTGTVRLSDRREGAPGAVATAFQGGKRALQADASGATFALGPLPPGIYGLRFDAPDHATVTLPFLALGKADVDLGVVLLAPGTAAVEADPSPLPGAQPSSISPRTLVATPGDRRVTLTWDPPKDGADGYRVYRSLGEAGTAAALTDSPTTARSYVDEAVTNYTRYRYRVTALLGGRESPLAEAPFADATPGAGNVLSGPIGTRTLDAAGSPWVVAGGDLVVLPGSTLTVSDGAELRFETGRKLVVQGALVAKGTPTRPVTFTALNSTWSGIVFDGSSKDAVFDAADTYLSGSVLAHAVVEKSNATGITIVDSAPLIEASEVRYNTQYTSATESYGGGIRVMSGAAPVIRGNSIHHNSAGLDEEAKDSVQWGGGIYSEGAPVIANNEISFNGLVGSYSATSTSYGLGLYLAKGRALVVGNRFAANAPLGRSPTSTLQKEYVRGLAIAVDDGDHVLLSNDLENNVNSRGGEVHGTVWIRSGTALLVRNRFFNNRVYTGRGAALSVEAATVRAYLNLFNQNALTNGTSNTGSALYVGESLSLFRNNEFSENTPAAWEIYNAGTVKLDLRDDSFPDIATASLAQRIYKLANADTSGSNSAFMGDTGPQACTDDADCMPLGTANTCVRGGCIPRCLLEGCTAPKVCEVQSGACN